MDTLRLLGFAGSLRKSSFNRQLLSLCDSLLPQNTEMNLIELNDIPLYNADIEAQGFPKSVITLKESITQAHGILVASAEYNYSVSGVLKNAIDWISRPPSEIPLEKKPCAIISASSSRFGGARSQQHLRQILPALGAYVMPQPELYIPQAQKVFIESEPIDEKTSTRIQSFLKAFIEFIQSINTNQGSVS
jgi:chromate reductase, NAD(P)H dehydrogenase (quinone)